MTTVEEKAKQIVRDGIIMDASWLMDAMVEYSENHPGDGVLNVDDYYGAGREVCPMCGSTRVFDFGEYLDTHPEFKTGDDGLYICDDCKSVFTEYNNREVFEYWFVSDWLEDQLIDEHESIIETNWRPIWCRCCTGQAIYIDGVIQNIAKKLLDEEERRDNPRLF